jgi:dihydroneopterin aldolase
MITVSLEGMHFYAHHGLYEEEKIIGNEWEVDVHVSFVPPAAVHDLQHSVDYEIVYGLVKQAMNIPGNLLEELAQSILQQIQERFPFAKKTEIIIRKKHPPLPGEVAHSVVRLVEEF